MGLPACTDTPATSDVAANLLPFGGAFNLEPSYDKPSFISYGGFPLAEDCDEEGVPIISKPLDVVKPVLPQPGEDDCEEGSEAPVVVHQPKMTVQPAACVSTRSICARSTDDVVQPRRSDDEGGRPCRPRSRPDDQEGRPRPRHGRPRHGRAQEDDRDHRQGSRHDDRCPHHGGAVRRGGDRPPRCVSLGPFDLLAHHTDTPLQYLCLDCRQGCVYHDHPRDRLHPLRNCLLDRSGVCPHDGGRSIDRCGLRREQG
jgi:hypothetical protein